MNISHLIFSKLRASLFRIYLPALMLSLLAGFGVANAQITVFSECNFQGKAISLAPGLYDQRSLARAGVANDSIASVVVPDGFSTTIYADDRFKGRSGTLYAASSCLDRDRFDNVISSLTIQPRGEEAAAAAAAEERYPTRTAGAAGGATFYSFCDYRGVEVELPPGEYRLADLQDAGINNNDISSVKVPRGYEVTVYANDFFRGKSSVLSDNDNCLRNVGLDEQVSSVIVRRNERMVAGNNTQSTNTNQSGGTEVVAYSECGYFGLEVALAPGEYKVADLKKLGMPNNAISSFRVPKGFNVAIYENDFFRGAGKILNQDDECLIGDQMNDKISSIVVEGSLASAGSSSAGTAVTAGGKKVAATVYGKCGFEGAKAQLDVGEYNVEDLLKLGMRENSISSIKVNPGYRIDVYFYNFQRGKNGYLTEDDSCLSNDGFDNEISSIKVSLAEEATAATVPTTPVSSSNSGAVTVFGKCDYAGPSVSLVPGRYTQDKLRTLGIGNDVVASLKVTPGHTVVLYDNGQMRGKGVAFKADDPCLDDDGLFRRVSAVVIVPDRKGGNSNRGQATSATQASRASLEAGLDCIGLYVERNICEARRWNDMRKRCNLDEVAGLSDGYLETHVRAGNCTTQYWQALRERVLDPSLR